MRRQSSKMYREQSACSNVRTLPAKPLNINHGHVLQISQSLPSHKLLPISAPKYRRTNSGHRLSMPVLSEVETAEFSPQEYLEHASFRTSPSSSQELSTSYQDTVSQIRSTHLWPSQEGPTLSPSSPHSGESSPLFSSTMSRQSSSITSSLSSGIDMIRIQSEGAGTCPSQDSTQCSTSLPNMITHNYQAYPTISYDLQQTVPSVDATATCTWSRMDPTKSAIGRELESPLQYKEDIIKKRPLTFEAPSAYESKAAILTNPPNPLIAIRSFDGKEKCAIPRTVAPRPPRQKLKCPHCSKHPEGFRGDHELRRHIDRAHAKKSRKVWVCVDASEGQTFLSKCKACTRGKTYGAYYNAAAHLRRVHFKPKEAGPKVKGIANRAGKGGGDWPPMEHLKSDWIREIDEHIDQTSASNTEDDTDESTDEPIDSLDLPMSTSGYMFDKQNFAGDGISLYQTHPPQHPFTYASNFSFSPSDDCNASCAVGQDGHVFS